MGATDAVGDARNAAERFAAGGRLRVDDRFAYVEGGVVLVAADAG